MNFPEAARRLASFANVLLSLALFTIFLSFSWSARFFAAGAAVYAVALLVEGLAAPIDAPLAAADSAPAAALQ